MVVRDEPPEGKALDIGHILEHLGQWGFPVSLRYTVFHATKIAYISTRSTGGCCMSADAYIMNPDGTGQTRLTNNLTEAYWNNAVENGRPQHRLSWSPDGKSIAFVTDFSGIVARDEGRYGQGDIYRIDANGTNLVNLTNHPARDSTPSWSPDGKKIAFMSDRSGRWEIYTINADGTKPLAITRNTPADANYNLLDEKNFIAFNFTWSPDSKKIAFVLEHGDKSGIHVVNADGTNQMRLTEPNLFLSWAPALSWSPDGKRIAFADYFKGIFVINADGTNLVRLTKSDEVFKPIRHPSWSPNGTKILFTAQGRNEQGSQIWVVTADGTRLTKLTSEWSANTAVWSPDGSMIACQEDGRKLCVMNADGTEPICWTPKVGRMFLPSWSPFFR
jgi:TolB protein